MINNNNNNNNNKQFGFRANKACFPSSWRCCWFFHLCFGDPRSLRPHGWYCELETIFLPSCHTFPPFVLLQNDVFNYVGCSSNAKIRSLRLRTLFPCCHLWVARTCTNNMMELSVNWSGYIRARLEEAGTGYYLFIKIIYL